MGYVKEHVDTLLSPPHNTIVYGLPHEPHDLLALVSGLPLAVVSGVPHNTIVYGLPHEHHEPHDPLALVSGLPHELLELVSAHSLHGWPQSLYEQQQYQQSGARDR